MTFQLTIVNQNAQQVFFRLNQPTDNVLYDGTSISDVTSLAVAAGATLSGISVGNYVGGKFLFSLGQALTFAAGSQPLFIPGQGGDSTTRWDKVEITNDGSPTGSMNLSSADFFGIEMQIQSFSATGALLQTAGWNASSEAMMQELVALSNENANAVVTGAGGVQVPGYADVIRVVSPSTAANPPAGYVSMQAYVNAMAGGAATSIVGLYTHGTSPYTDFTTQNYQFSMTIDASGDMILQGGGDAVGTGHTIEIAAADVANAIYTANPFFTVDGSATSSDTAPPTAYSVGYNDVYATAVRDALAGFNAGFVGSTVIDPTSITSSNPSGTMYKDETTAQWFSGSTDRQLDAFGAAQPGNPTYYNQYAGDVSQSSDSYGFPFNELLTHPLVNLDPSSVASVTITILADPAPDPLFNAAYYLANNPDVAAAGVDPYQHYMNYGWKEGRNPDAWFNTRYYLAQNPDVAAAGVDPLLHFEAYGWKEGRDPSAQFSVRDYLDAYPDVKAAGVDPLAHYITYGIAEGRHAFAVPAGGYDPGVDIVYYDQHNPDVVAAGLDATTHYTTYGWQEGRDPDAWFDTNYYLQQNPDVKAAGIDPLTHYETYGWQEGRLPSLLFDGNKYLAANPDVKAAQLDPLIHYLEYGQYEGRATFLTGGTAPADPLVQTAFYDQQLGATLIPTGTAGAEQAAWSYDATGWKQGLNPDPLFDTQYYLSHNPDVAAAGVDPLAHYETYGWKEGRDPSAAFSTSKYLAAHPDVTTDPLLQYYTAGQSEGYTPIPV